MEEKNHKQESNHSQSHNRIDPLQAFSLYNQEDKVCGLPPLLFESRLKKVERSYHQHDTMPRRQKNHHHQGCKITLDHEDGLIESAAGSRPDKPAFGKVYGIVSHLSPNNDSGVSTNSMESSPVLSLPPTPLRPSACSVSSFPHKAQLIQYSNPLQEEMSDSNNRIMYYDLHHPDPTSSLSSPSWPQQFSYPSQIRQDDQAVYANCAVPMPNNDLNSIRFLNSMRAEREKDERSLDEWVTGDLRLSGCQVFRANPFIVSSSSGSESNLFSPGDHESGFPSPSSAPASSTPASSSSQDRVARVRDQRVQEEQPNPGDLNSKKKIPDERDSDRMIRQRRHPHQTHSQRRMGEEKLIQHSNEFNGLSTECNNGSLDRETVKSGPPPAITSSSSSSAPPHVRCASSPSSAPQTNVASSDTESDSPASEPANLESAFPDYDSLDGDHDEYVDDVRVTQRNMNGNHHHRNHLQSLNSSSFTHQNSRRDKKGSIFNKSNNGGDFLSSSQSQSSESSSEPVEDCSSTEFSSPDASDDFIFTASVSVMDRVKIFEKSHDLRRSHSYDKYEEGKRLMALHQELFQEKQRRKHQNQVFRVSAKACPILPVAGTSIGCFNASSGRAVTVPASKEPSCYVTACHPKSGHCNKSHDHILTGKSAASHHQQHFMLSRTASDSGTRSFLPKHKKAISSSSHHNHRHIHYDHNSSLTTASNTSSDDDCCSKPEVKSIISKNYAKSNYSTDIHQNERIKCISQRDSNAGSPDSGYPASPCNRKPQIPMIFRMERALKHKKDPFLEAHSVRTNDALTELENMYNDIGLKDDEDLLDRAERRDLPEKFQLMRFQNQLKDLDRNEEKRRVPGLLPPPHPKKKPEPIYANLRELRESGTEPESHALMEIANYEKQDVNSRSEDDTYSAYGNTEEESQVWRKSILGSDYKRCPPPRRSAVPDIVCDDLAVRKLNSVASGSLSSGVGDVKKLPTPSYLLCSPVFTPSLSVSCGKLDLIPSNSDLMKGGIEGEPNIELDDLSYRRQMQSEAANVLPPHPPFGIPKEVVDYSTGSDYVHAEIKLEEKKKVFYHVKSVKNDMAFRNLRKDDDSTQPNSPPLLPVTTYNMMLINVRKQLRATRSLSSNINKIGHTDHATKIFWDRRPSLVKSASYGIPSTPSETSSFSPSPKNQTVSTSEEKAIPKQSENNYLSVDTQVSDDDVTVKSIDVMDGQPENSIATPFCDDNGKDRDNSPDNPFKKLLKEVSGNQINLIQTSSTTTSPFAPLKYLEELKSRRKNPFILMDNRMKSRGNVVHDPSPKDDVTASHVSPDVIQNLPRDRERGNLEESNLDQKLHYHETKGALNDPLENNR